MPLEITLIDRGRGFQLSTSRITVHDVVPYFQQGCAYDEIIRWLPSLTEGEVSVVEPYYLEHKDELDEYERRVQMHRAEQSRLQRLRLGEQEGNRQERLAQQRERLKQPRRGTIPHAAMSETSANCWKLSVIRVFSPSAWVVESPSSVSSMAPRKSAKAGWYRP